MKQLFKFSMVVLAGLVMVLAGCKREDVNFIGPAYVSAPEGFAVTSFTATTTTTPTVDFTADDVVYNATFTHNVSWILTIKGQTSGAVHEVRGTSNGLTNVVWTGIHDAVMFFRPGETAIATLSFYNSSVTASASVTITTAPDFTSCGKFSQYGDFEDLTKITPVNAWHPFNAAGNFPSSNAVDYKGNIVPPVQGNSYYVLRGLGSQPVFVNGIQNTYWLTNNPNLPADPEQVWVNIYIYGNGDPNAGIELEYQEADADGTTPDYQGTDDDAWTAKFTIDHVGWKLFSFKYSSLTPSLNADFGGSGNKIQEPDKLKSWDIILIKKLYPDKKVEVYFDFPIITIGGPFKPCN